MLVLICLSFDLSFVVLDTLTEQCVPGPRATSLNQAFTSPISSVHFFQLSPADLGRESSENPSYGSRARVVTFKAQDRSRYEFIINTH